MRRCSFGLTLGCALGALALLALTVRCERVAIEGDSMLPTLAPGDRLLAWRVHRVEPGWLVVVPDPRAPERSLVKRAARVRGREVELRGDNPDSSTDSRAFGWVPADHVEARVRYRYAPPERAGRL